MRPPVKKPLDSHPADAPQVESRIDSEREALAKKRKLAQHLHDQGINPLTWTDAHPASQAAQRQFQETGRKLRDNQFDVSGRLYDWAPSVNATPAQAKAIADAYAAGSQGLAARRPVPVETLVDIAQVPLRHPLGTPHSPRAAANQNDPAAAAERMALYRHYAKSGVDPDKAHLGDPPPMREQEKLKAEMAKLPAGGKTELGGLPVFYQGFDDGWIYQANASTEESAEVQRIRLAQANDDSANDHAPELIEQIARHYLDRGAGSEADGILEYAKTSGAPPAFESDADNDGTSPDESLKRKHDNHPAGDLNPRADIVELQSFIQSMPAVISVVDKLQAGDALTPAEGKILDRILIGLEKAGIEFDYTLSDPDQMREVYAKAVEILQKARQGGEEDTSGITLGTLTLRGTQALAGGPFDRVRMNQSGSLLKRLSLASQSLLPAAKKLAVPATTVLNVEAAKEGPIDYDGAYKEIHDLFVGGESTASEDSGTSTESIELLNATSPGKLQTTISSQREDMDAETFKSKLTTFDEVTIYIGDVVLRQHPLTTATDQIFIEELLAVAQSKGCDPEPDPTAANPDRKAVYGGNEAQRRITDIDKPGHIGSAQPDGATRLAGHGNRGEVWFNSVSTFADGLRILGREVVSAKRILDVAIKQLGASQDVLDKLVNPVKARGHLYLYRKKWQWSLDKIREDLRSKIKRAFDQYYQDCLPKGPSSIIDLDGIE